MVTQSLWATIQCVLYGLFAATISPQNVQTMHNIVFIKCKDQFCSHIIVVKLQRVCAEYSKITCWPMLRML